MKRLKYTCLFGGKTYPGLVVVILMFIMMFGSIGFPPLLFLFPFAVIGTLCFCIFWEHSLSDSERRFVSQLEYPLWQPVTPEIRQIVTEQKQSTQLNLIQLTGSSALCGGLAFLLLSVPPRSGDSLLITNPEIPFVVCIAVGIITFLCLMIRKGIGANWLDMDDSAAFIKVPIDHMYDVTHHSRYGRTWTTSYLVFYLPDGKYILPVPKGSGESNTVVIVKFGKAVTWMLTYEFHPVDFSR